MHSGIGQPFDLDRRDLRGHCEDRLFDLALEALWLQSRAPPLSGKLKPHRFRLDAQQLDPDALRAEWSMHLVYRLLHP